ncbi:unnamed protein product, partial [marine sediment metagenome]
DNPDTDGDGYSDGEEIDAGTDPTVYNKLPKITNRTLYYAQIGQPIQVIADVSDENDYI